MKVKPPCKTHDGIECDRRYIGCHADCEQFQKYLLAHHAEKELIRQNRYRAQIADEFLATQAARTKKAQHRDYMRNYMNDNGGRR